MYTSLADQGPALFATSCIAELCVAYSENLEEAPNIAIVIYLRYSSQLIFGSSPRHHCSQSSEKVMPEILRRLLTQQSLDNYSTYHIDSLLINYYIRFVSVSWKEIP